MLLQAGKQPPTCGRYRTRDTIIDCHRHTYTLTSEVYDGLVIHLKNGFQQSRLSSVDTFVMEITSFCPLSAPMGVLNCSTCAAQTEAACTANQKTRECLMDQLCLTLETMTTTNQTSFTRDCFPSMVCSFPSVICDIINQTSNGTTLSCNAECCNTSLCNAGVSPLIPSSGAPAVGKPVNDSYFKISNSNFYRKSPSCVHFKTCNSNFYRKNPSCLHFKICNSNFYSKYPSCGRFRICNSNFYRKNPSCMRFKHATRIFPAKILVVCVSKCATDSNSYRKNPSESYCRKKSVDFRSKI